MAKNAQSTTPEMSCQTHPAAAAAQFVRKKGEKDHNKLMRYKLVDEENQSSSSFVIKSASIMQNVSADGTKYNGRSSRKLINGQRTTIAGSQYGRWMHYTRQRLLKDLN